MTEISTKPIVDAGGYALFEQDKKLFFVNYGVSWLYTFNFVLILLFIILLVNGIIQLTMNVLAGIILSSIAIVVGLALYVGIHSIKKAKRKPFENLNILAIVNLESKEFLNKNRQVIAPLSSVQFKRAFQIYSSSLAICATWPQGSITVVRGNPFAGGSGDFISALKKRGLMQ